jgi:Tfp pilus assembly protein PilF
MSEDAGWPLWRRDNPAGLLGYVSPEAVPLLLPDLPPCALGQGDPLTVVRSVYQAFTTAAIRYADEPMASTGMAQQIRPPDQVLVRPKDANCLDVAITFAGACLSCGLHPLLVTCDTDRGDSAHAVVVVWLGGFWPSPGGDARYPAPGPGDRPLVLLEPPRWPGGLRQVADGPGQFIPVDVSLALARRGEDPASFTDAVDAAAAVLSGGTRGTESAAAPAWRWEFGLDIGLHYLPETSLRPAPAPDVPPLEPPYRVSASAGDGPLAQLGARTATVPFVDRGELDLLLDWCRGQDNGVPAGQPADADRPSIQIAVVEGIGGCGKTRLAAELAARLAENHGWYTGFAVRRFPTGAALRWLARIVSPVLIVVDYVEATDITALAESIRALASRRSRTALLFTARTRGDWWKRLDRELTSADVSRAAFPEMILPPRPDNSARLFSRAYRRFTTAGATAILDEPPPPGDSTRWTALDLVMLAWLAAHVGPDLPATPSRLYEAIIDRELFSWADAMERGNRPRPTERALRTAAACIALLSPSASRLDELLDRADIRRHTSLAPTEIAEPLADLLGQHGASELDLRPDPVADYLLLTTFPNDRVLFDACVDFAAEVGPATVGGQGLADSGGRPETERFCDNLTRAGEALTIDGALITARNLATAALSRQAGLWSAAFGAALNRGGSFVAGLEELAARDGTPLVLPDISARIPFGHTALRQLALMVAQRIVPPLGPQPTAAEQSARADALDTLVTRLHEAERSEEALEAAREAIGLRRKLAEGSPEADPIPLAKSLGTLARALCEAEQAEEALAPAREAVDIWRQLAHDEPGIHQGGLVATLGTLALALSRAGHVEESLAPAREAVDICRELAHDGPGIHQGGLVVTLGTLALALSRAGHVEDSLAPAREAIDIWRQLAHDEPRIHQSELVMTLDMLAQVLSVAGRVEEALAITEEKVAVYRQLAHEAPGIYLGQLADSLNALAQAFSAAGRAEGAVAAAQEAVAIVRLLAQDGSGVNLDGFAGTLGNLAVRLASAGRREEAVGPAEKAVAIYRQLAHDAPGDHQGSLADALGNLAAFLAGAERAEEALAPAREAVDIYRQLEHDAPGDHQGSLAGALGNLAAFLGGAERAEEALAAAEESVAVYRQLMLDEPRVYRGGLAAALSNLMAHLSKAERMEEALAAAEESVTLFKQSAQDSPGNDRGSFAMILGQLAARAGRRDEALEWAEVAVAAYRLLAEDSLGAHRPELAGALLNLTDQLATAERPEEALGRAEEAVGIYRGLVNEAPSVYRENLAAALSRVAATLSHLGRTEEVEASANELVSVCRLLVEDSPHAHRGKLAGALGNLAAFHGEAGRPERAVAPAREAVAVFRQLTDDEPDARSDLARALSNLALALAKVGIPEEALAPAEEAVGLYRRAAHDIPGMLPSLAGELGNLAIYLSGAEQPEEALAPSREAIAVYRQLAGDEPGARDGLATALTNMTAFLGRAGRPEEALVPAREAVAVYRQLTDENPEARGGLASALANLAQALLEVGRAADALAPAEEAVAVSQQLAQDEPSVHLGWLARSLKHLASSLSAAGRMDEALRVFAAAASSMPAGPQAEIYASMAHWLADKPEAAPEEYAAALARAITSAEAESDPRPGASARKAVRAAVSRPGAAGLAVSILGGELPVWATAEVPEGMARLIEEIVRLPTWRARATVLREARASMLFAPETAPARKALAALNSDQDALLEFLNTLDAAAGTGRELVLAEACAAEQHAEELDGWLRNPTWTASRKYLGEHPDLLADERTAALLAQCKVHQTCRQYLAIARLATTMDVDDVYDIVLDAEDATKSALAALSAGQLDQVVEIWNAAPALRAEPFTGNYLAAILLTLDGQLDEARDVMQEAAQEAVEATRVANADRLRRLARQRTELAGALTDLAGLLSVAPHADRAVPGPAQGRHAGKPKTSHGDHADHVPRAAFNLGLLLAAQGDVAGATAAYQKAIDSGHADYTPAAAVNLGVLLAGQGDVAGAKAAYQMAIDSRHATHAPAAAMNLGVLLAGQDDVAGATAAYRKAIRSRHADHASGAAVNLGLLLAGQDDVAGATAAYRKAIRSRHADNAPLAANNRGVLMASLGNVTAAKADYLKAIDSGHADHGPRAAVGLGQLLAGQGDMAGAIAAYQKAADSGHAEFGPRAAVGLGQLLAGQGDMAGAIAAYQKAADSGHPDYAPAAARILKVAQPGWESIATIAAVFEDPHHGDDPEPTVMARVLGAVLAAIEDETVTTAAYKKALDSGQPGVASSAAVKLGMMLAAQGEVAEAEEAYKKAIEGRHPHFAGLASLGMGLLMDGQGDVAGAKAAYEEAITSSPPVQAAMAKWILGMLMERQGDVAQAKETYRQLLEDGHPYVVMSAAISLGKLLEEEGDLAGAQAVLRKGIEDSDPYLMSYPALELGMLLASKQDLAGARVAYQKVIDSGNAELVPIAEILLGEQCMADDHDGQRLHRERAAASGDADTLVAIALLYAVDGAVTRAKQLLDQAGPGCDNAVHFKALLEDHECTTVAFPALEAVRAAAEQDDVASMDFLGLHALSHGTREAARSWWTRSAALDDLVSPLLLARLDQAESDEEGNVAEAHKPARGQAAWRRTSQTVAPMSSTDSASSQPPSIHWKGESQGRFLPPHCTR